MMGFNYQLQFKDEFLDFFKSENDHANEADLINEMMKTLTGKRLHLIEMQLKLLFDKFETRNHESKFWHDNLKTFLAHGFSFYNPSKKIQLAKSFEPLKFTLFAETTKSGHHFGFFYEEFPRASAEQFIHFCKVTEYPPGINEYIISEVIMNGGGSLLATNSHNTTILIKRDALTDIISGSDEVIMFLSKPATRPTG